MNPGELDPSKPIVEEGLSQEAMARIKAMSDEDMPELQVIPAPSEDPTPPQTEITFDGPNAVKPEDKPAEKPEDKPAEKPEDKPAEKPEDKPAEKPEDKPAEKPGEKVKLTIAGEEKEFTFHELRAGMGRQAALSRRLNELNTSDEMKLGTLLAAAQGGDKQAAKQVQQMLTKGLGKENAEDVAEELEDVEGEFDPTKKLLERHQEAEMAEAFADVDQEGVDFQQNMDTVKTVLKGKMPEKVYEAYFDNAWTRRTMFDLVASGRMEKLLSAFDKQLETLPFEKQLEIRNDPKLFGDAFQLVVQQQNASSTETNEGSGQDEKTGLDSVSGDTRSPEAAKPQGDAPDFANMSKDEFEKFQRHNKLIH